MATTHSHFVETVNESVIALMHKEQRTSGEVCVMAPVSKGFKPTRRDIEAIRLKNIKMEQVKNGKLFDESGNCIFDVCAQDFDIFRIVGNL